MRVVALVTLDVAVAVAATALMAVSLPSDAGGEVPVAAAAGAELETLCCGAVDPPSAMSYLARMMWFSATNGGIAASAAALLVFPFAAPPALPAPPITPLVPMEV